MQYSGVVSNVSSFDYQGKKLWSFQLNNEKGTYYRTGAVRPKAETGQFVVFFGEPGKNGSVNVDSKTIEVKEGEQASSGVGSFTRSKPNPVPSNGRDFPTKDEREATQKRIEIQSCRNSALEFIKILFQQEAIKVPAKNKVDFLEELLNHYQKKFIDNNSGIEDNIPVDPSPTSDDKADNY
jgi:hypothetical protein